MAVLQYPTNNDNYNDSTKALLIRIAEELSPEAALAALCIERAQTLKAAEYDLAQGRLDLAEKVIKRVEFLDSLVEPVLIAGGFVPVRRAA
jgi:hypothetical protein